MSNTEILLTVRGQWAETQYLRRNGTLYRRGVNGGWGGGRDPKDFRAHAEEITERELEAEILAHGLEDDFDAGKTGLVVEVGR